MRAIVYETYGPPEVLTLKEIETPRPDEHGVLIRIRAAGVTAEDPRQRALSYPPLLRFFVGVMFGFRRPRKQVLGFEYAGVVESVGKNVVRWKPGDEVYGYTGLGFGAYAEFLLVPDDAVMARKPACMSFAEAAVVPNGALSALVFLKLKAKLKPGDDILIYGASGSVGTAAVQLAKVMGAKVTALASQGNLPLLESLGADKVLDYTSVDFTTLEQTWDVIFDVVGKTDISSALPRLRSGGTFIVTEGGPALLMKMLRSRFSDKPIKGAASNFY